MKKQELQRGDLAFILRGKGAGRIALVLGIDREGRCLLSDGRRLRVESPKAKSQKHLVRIGSAEGADASDNRRVRRLLRDAEAGIID